MYGVRSMCDVRCLMYDVTALSNLTVLDTSYVVLLTSYIQMLNLALL